MSREVEAEGFPTLALDDGALGSVGIEIDVLHPREREGFLLPQPFDRLPQFVVIGKIPQRALSLGDHDVVSVDPERQDARDVAPVGSRPREVCHVLLKVSGEIGSQEPLFVIGVVRVVIRPDADHKF